MLAQTTELIDQGQTFAERFGWEALVVILVIFFAGFLIYRFGGQISTAVAKYLEASLAQLNTQAETQARTSEAITLLSATAAADSECQKRIEMTAGMTHAKVDRMMTAFLSAARIAYDAIPEDSPEAKEKLLRVIKDLER